MVKGLLHSNIWDIIIEDSLKEQSISFNIPDKCISLSAHTCQLTEIVNDKMTETSLLDEDFLTPAAPKRKRRGDQPLVESEVRRSARIQEFNDGFKGHTACSNLNYLSCTAIPPELSNKIVKNLATSFCKVADKDLEEKAKKKGKVLMKGKHKEVQKG